MILCLGSQKGLELRVALNLHGLALETWNAELARDVGEPHEDDDGESNGPENPGSRPRACGLGLIPVGILSLLLLCRLRLIRSHER